MLRTHTCGELRLKNEGEKVTLCGWVHRRRDHGGLIFIDLRDRYGITQIVTGPEDKDAFAMMEKTRPEWVLCVTGTVGKRKEGAARKDNPTGDIEILVSAVTPLNEAKTPPFEIDLEGEINEELRLQYRYLDMRRIKLKDNLVLRHKLLQAVRRFFYDRDFIEVETPILIKGTPEGAREYVVPSRVYHGLFYVLPQSPQQLKQLSMVGGLDRYMQIARCFRDEDLRGDRQPEFTQMDLEMSFVTAEDVMGINEEALISITKEVRPDVKIRSVPFPRMSWEEAMGTYGSDKPDLRFGLEFTDVTDLSKGSGFGIFAKTAEGGGVVKALRVPEGAALSRKDIDELTETAKVYGAKGLAWIKSAKRGYEGVPVDKLGADLTKKMAEKAGMKDGDILFFTADTFEVACLSLGAVRSDIAKRKKLADPNVFAFAWITDFPMFEIEKETGELQAMHHPFTRPKDADLPLLEKEPLKVKAEAYDIVLNGYEIGGGSVRIHERALQKQIFDILKVSDEDAERRFGHMLKAFEYGAPPHGGIAWGLDRMAMLYAGEPNIREVIAFPKDQKGKDLLLGAPSVIPEKQLKELGVKIMKA
ncbi:MAG: aspartate--tRNA ligase [Candidatus Peribacteraceae bacterium]|nr:aspartate--tRNA ligase [Candidatus Peribacteraceae bacterium]